MERVPDEDSVRFPLLTRRQALALAGVLAAPWAELRARAAGAISGPSSPARNGGTGGPDLGNLHAVLERIGRADGPVLSFLDSKWTDLETWKSAARPVFHAHLHYKPDPQPLEARVVNREERDGFSVEEVRITAVPSYEIPARVLVPRKRKGRLPAIVALHCHGGRFTWGHEKLVSHPNDSPPLLEYRERYYGRPWAEMLARSGYVVIASDAFYFGARRLRVEELDPERVLMPVREAAAIARREAANSAAWTVAVNEACSFYENLVAKNIFAAGATWPGIHVWDDMRTVDYLMSRPEVDPSRIGCTGLSMGGIRAAHLIAADRRIKAACVTGWMSDFLKQLRNNLRFHTWAAFIPGLYGTLDVADAAALHAPGALLVQQCRQDVLYPVASMEAAVEKLARIYAKARIPERFRGSFYDQPHSFKPPMQDEALAWFHRWL